MPKLLFEKSVRGHILQNEHHALRLAACVVQRRAMTVVQRRAMTNDAERGSVLGLTGESHSPDVLPACQSFKEPVEFRGVRGHGDRTGATDHFLARITEDTLGRDVPDPHAAFGGEEKKSVAQTH